MRTSTRFNFPSDTALPSDTSVVPHIQQNIISLLRSEQFNDRDIFAIRLAVEEALVNAIKHGNQQDRNKQVMLSYYLEDDAFCIRIRDEGPGFDPTSVPDPTLQENLERCSGRGLMLMRYYMTEVHFLERGNLVIMKKLRNGTTAKSSA